MTVQTGRGLAATLRDSNLGFVSLSVCQTGLGLLAQLAQLSCLNLPLASP